MTKDKYRITVKLTLHRKGHLRGGRANAVASCAFVPPLVSLANIPDAKRPGWAKRVPIRLCNMHVVFDPCYDWFRSTVSGAANLNSLSSRHNDVCRRLHDGRRNCWKEVWQFSLILQYEIHGEH